jgi:hypothetical protein
MTNAIIAWFYNLITETVNTQNKEVWIFLCYFNVSLSVEPCIYDVIFHAPRYSISLNAMQLTIFQGDTNTITVS